MISTELIASIANSAFTTSLLGALAGAFGGAYVAQRVAERTRLRDELTREIRAVNAAIGLSITVANSALASKAQHVLPMWEHFQAEKARHKEWSEKRKAGLIPNDLPFELSAALQVFPAPSPPIEALQEFVLSRIGLIGRPISLVVTLGEVLRNLDESIKKRGEHIASFRSRNLPPGASVPVLFLGLTFSDGHRSTEYPDVVNAIRAYTDNVIFFSAQLASDLRDHGLNVSANYRRNFNDAPPKVTDVDFSTARARGLMPDESDYRGYLEGFAAPQATRAWWHRDT